MLWCHPNFSRLSVLEENVSYNAFEWAPALSILAGAEWPARWAQGIVNTSLRMLEEPTASQSFNLSEHIAPLTTFFLMLPCGKKTTPFWYFIIESYAKKAKPRRLAEGRGKRVTWRNDTYE